MDVTPLIKQGQQIIQSYAGGQFTVSGEIFNHAIIVTPDETISWNAPNQISDLNENHFTALLDKSDEIDVVLLGTGATMQFFNTDLKSALSQKGLPVDVMDTGAACRTYNVLMAEGRRVAVALFPSQ